MTAVSHYALVTLAGVVLVVRMPTVQGNQTVTLTTVPTVLVTALTSYQSAGKHQLCFQIVCIRHVCYYIV